MMSEQMPPLAGVKKGDKLFVFSRLDKGRIVIADRVTPAGRVVTVGGQVFNPDGWKRGEREAWSPTKARVATEDDIAVVNRWALVQKIETFRSWDKLAPDDLKTVGEIIARTSLKDKR